MITEQTPTEFIEYGDFKAEFAQVFKEHIKELLADRGDWNRSLYDEWWVLFTDFFDLETRNQKIREIIERQNSDGSFGDPKVPHSCLVDTLQALMGIAYFNTNRERYPDISIDIPNPKLIAETLKILAGRCYEYKGQDFVAFELIFTQLIVYLINNEWFQQNYGEIIGEFIRFLLKEATPEVQYYIGDMIGKGVWKLALFRTTGNLFNPEYSISFALESAFFLNDITDEELLSIPAMILENGSIGLSPAATAGIVSILEKHKARLQDKINVEAILTQLGRYLTETYEDYRSEYFPNLHPIDISRWLWNLLPWVLSGNISELIKADPSVLDVLKEIANKIKIEANGVPWAIAHKLKDGDDTAVTFALLCILKEAGVEDIPEFDLDIFTHFQNADGSFFCYEFEGDPSFGFILHFINSMEHALRVGNGDTDKIRSYLISAVSQLKDYYLDGYGYSIERIIYDKWHGAKHYGIRSWLSSEAIFLMLPEEITHIVDILVNDQMESGGWGEFGEDTLEDTSYTISALTKIYEHLCIHQSYLMNDERFADLYERLPYIRSALSRASSYFYARPSREGNPAGEEIKINREYISKNAYNPKNQVVSAIINANYDLTRLKAGLQGDPSRSILNKIDLSEKVRSNILVAYGSVVSGIRELTGKVIKDFTDGEKFSALWAMPLEIKNGLYKASNTLMMGLDAIAESTTNVEELTDFMNFIDSLVDPEVALEMLEQLNHEIESGYNLSIYNGCMYLICWMVVEACKALDSNMSQFWLENLRKALHDHDAAQIESSKLSMSSEISNEVLEQVRNKLITQFANENNGFIDYKEALSLRNIMKIYTEKYKDTVGMSPIMLSSLYASPKISESLIRALNLVVDNLTPELSMASQIIIEEENVNLAIFYVALTQKVSIEEAKQKLFNDEDKSLLTDLQRKMRIEWENLFIEYIEEGSRRIDMIKTNFNNEFGETVKENAKIVEVVEKFNNSLNMVADKLATPDIEFVLNVLKIPVEAIRVAT